MSKNKELRYRTICPLCGKAFDRRVEGKLFIGDNRWHCDDCHAKEMVMYGFGTIDDDYARHK